MTGYQEVLTDPSYTGQLVAMTYPLIGNYGVNSEDRESPLPQVNGGLETPSHGPLRDSAVDSVVGRLLRNSTGDPAPRGGCGGFR